ncbi:GyrI-like domain-containing protein [Campylobacter molothri]|uniref:GyrI-like domain-containing protein n=1 Tax=Campylobacter molothri TaxID=1032242 RepID=UPI00301DB2B3|nr:GyrI-like domain-containing protein [Campylobacter sp. RM10542]
MIKQIQEFAIFGVTTSTDKKLESDKQTSKIFPLWKDFHRVFGAPDEIYSVYYDYKDLEFKIGVGIKNPCQNAEKILIKSGSYMIFEDFGKPEIIVPKIWSKIEIFFKNSDIKRAFLTDFEFYTSSKTQIYISIKDNQC